jgi:hypothetical protein
MLERGREEMGADRTDARLWRVEQRWRGRGGGGSTRSILGGSIDADGSDTASATVS